MSALYYGDGQTPNTLDGAIVFQQGFMRAPVHLALPGSSTPDQPLLSGMLAAEGLLQGVYDDDLQSWSPYTLLNHFSGKDWQRLGRMFVFAGTLLASAGVRVFRVSLQHPGLYRVSAYLRHLGTLAGSQKVTVYVSWRDVSNSGLHTIPVAEITAASASNEFIGHGSANVFCVPDPGDGELHYSPAVSVNPTSNPTGSYVVAIQMEPL